MDFSLTPEQEAIRKLAHEFADKEVKPRAQELDRLGRSGDLPGCGGALLGRRRHREHVLRP
ncbi:MAG: acyl-CoA dehydrogenase family protein [Dehalococcoidia bacterium]|nr:acyl-CoA dehydrogenase family protein [Dehalococcoidia bacterium]